MAKFKNTTPKAIRIACIKTGFVATFKAGEEREVGDAETDLCVAALLTPVGKKVPAKKVTPKTE